jgi:oligopeptidase B
MTGHPVPPKRSHSITQHGVTRIDEYFWMCERENPELVKYLMAENKYLQEVLQHTQPLQDQLFDEMKGRIKETDATFPEKYRGHYYYKRQEAGRQYPIYCRKKGSLDAPEEILLDQNKLAKGRQFCSVSAFSVSPDGTKLAYSVDLEGTEIYTIRILNLLDGSLYPEIINGTFGSVYSQIGVEWANNSQTLYYVSLDSAHRTDKVYKHQLGTDPANDVLILHEKDDTYSLMMFKTRSQALIMFYHYNSLSQEMHFMPADDPDSKPKLIQARQPGLEYFATHGGDSFFIITNNHANNYRLMKTPLSAPGLENWQELVGHREDVLIEQVDAFEDFIVLHERKNGLKQLRISKADGVTNTHYVSFPDPTYDVMVETNPEFRTNILRIKYSSLITPHSIIEVNMDTGAWDVKKMDEIPTGYDKSQYATGYLHAVAPDGTMIPLSIVYKKGMQKNGQNPTLLYGYGAYGSSSEATFNASLISLLDRGFVFAMAHVRGGSEMGRSWFEEGRLFKKINSFTDFIACAEHLIKDGYTSREKLAITGSSAGGLLVGAAMVMRPDLFKAVICKVPFLDVITGMSDPKIPLVTLEYDQWGNPEDKDAFDYMLSYSPYDNLHPNRYPALLLTTGFNDPRVAYWEPAKFGARLRDVSQGNNLVLLHTDFNAGHAGASGRYDLLKENVLDFVFLIDNLGVDRLFE